MIVAPLVWLILDMIRSAVRSTIDAAWWAGFWTGAGACAALLLGLCFIVSVFGRK